MIFDDASALGAVVDPGEGALGLWREASAGRTLDKILLTHAHIDHILGLGALKDATGAPIYLHAADRFLVEELESIAALYGLEVEPAPLPDVEWKDGDRVRLGETDLEVIHTPGHSPGSVSLRFSEGVFTGDALFAGSIGRTDLPGGSFEVLERSIKERLYRLPEALVIYPGHMGTSTIGEERRSNPFVRG